MSFVGPRPPLTYHPWPLEEYTDAQRRMFEVRPGITGWAQVNGRKEVEWHERIRLNVWYVDHCSLLLDIKIIFKTLFKVLKNEETMELLRRSKEGDKEARQQLIEGNLRLVLSVIQRFSSRGENPDDLFQVGCVGLIKAIDNFDINQPVRFSTYGVPMIIGEIRRYLRDNSAIRVSRSMRDTAYRVLQVRDRILAQTQREPTVEQIAKELDIPREDVVFAMDAIVEPVSLYEPVYSDGGDAICVMDQVSDNRNTDENWTDRIALKDALERLDERERRILSLRFYEGKTQMEVSAEVGISQAQVSRLEKGAINTIKKNIQ
jgi:RNA polymerase sporulation-specific sigma factor